MKRAIALVFMGFIFPVAHGQLVEIDNSSVTIVGSAPAFDVSFSVANVIDTGSGSDLSDYASLGQGVNTYVDFDFGEAIEFGRITYVDRVTSGGAQGSFFGGTTDFVTAYDYIFSQDAVFGNGDDVSVSVTGLVAPGSPSSPADFTTSTDIGSISAQYLRWDVTASNPGANVGASDFEFYAVPEPATASMIALVLPLIFGFRRWVGFWA